MVRRWVAFLIVLPGLGALRGAAQTAAEPAPAAAAAPDAGHGIATIRTTARLVVLDVVVSDGHGHPLRGLQAADFALTEDGVAQRITGFTEHDGAVEPPLPDAWATEEKLPPNTFAVHPPVRGNGAMTAIVLGTMALRDRVFVRDQIKAYAKTATPETPIAIFTLDYLGMHLIQDFTSDQKMLQEAADSKRILPPLGLPPIGTVVSHGTLHLSQYLNSIPGRINVIWFGSGGGGLATNGGSGFDDAFADMSRFVEDLNGTTSVLRLSRVAVYAVDANGTCVPDISDGVEKGCLADVNFPPPTLFAVPDVPGARREEMAESTGGRAINYTNGFQQAITDIVATGSHYYTVSYTPTNHNWDDSYRKISVDVNTEAGKAQRLADLMNNTVKVEYRRGYYAHPAPLAPEVAAAKAAASEPQRKLISMSPKGYPGLGHGGQEDAMKRAMAFASATPVEIAFKMAVTGSEEMDRVKGNAVMPKDNYLTADWKNTPFRNYRVHYSVDPKVLHMHPGTSEYHDTLRFVIVVYRDNGEPVNSIATMVPIDLNAAQYAQVMRSGLSFEQTVAVPQKINTNQIPVTANFFLRAGVEEVETGRIGAVEVPVEWVKAPVAETAQAK